MAELEPSSSEPDSASYDQAEVECGADLDAVIERLLNYKNKKGKKEAAGGGGGGGSSSASPTSFFKRLEAVGQKNLISAQEVRAICKAATKIFLK